ncbi:MAG: 3-oxoacyl-ACP synthase [Flavobacteriaceae bacterium]|nr:3-oxoacyl-ACP synthase [Flavobacteriaceae bacterium]
MAVKEQLYQACTNFVQKKEASVLKTIQSNQEALNSETKSSAGDKHETGRSMLQLEMEKASQQLEVVYAMKATLQRINFSDTSGIVKLGSLVITDKTNYYLTISAGEIKVEDDSYYAVSANSPIGKLLLGKKVDDTITFLKEITIKEIL